MPAINDSIVEQFELLGLSPEEISAQEGLSIEVIKAVLIQSSTKYRQTLKKLPDTEFTDGDIIEANRIIREAALYSDDIHLQFKAATYIRDDKKGRKDIIRQIQSSPSINAFTFNIQFQKAQEAIERAKNKVVDIVGEAIGTNGKSLAQ